MKNLIYLCVFYDREFVNLLKLFVESYVLYNNHKNKDIDLMVMTNPEFERGILEICRQYDIDILIRTIDLCSVVESKISRLGIFEYEKINEYANVLYLDTDVLISGDLARVFDYDFEEKLYVVREGDIGNNYHGKFLFDLEKDRNIDYKTGAFNSGVLLFKNCYKINKLFNEIKYAIIDYNSKYELKSHVDQPFFNYYTLKSNLHEMNFLHCLSTNNPHGKTLEVICHFAGNYNGVHNKYKDMEYVLEKMKRGLM